MNDRIAAFGPLDHEIYAQSRIRAAATRLRRLASRNGRPPFDPFVLCQALGIEVRPVGLPPDTHGALVVSPAETSIEVNQDEAATRQRFTVAHEVAHLLFRDDIPALPRERWQPDCWKAIVEREERLCNQLAAEFLMPAQSFRRLARELRPGRDSLTALATKYAVSLDAVLTRILTTRAWNVALVQYAVSGDGGLQARRRPRLVLRGSRSRRQLAMRERLLAGVGLCKSILCRMVEDAVGKRGSLASQTRSIPLARFAGSAWARLGSGEIILTVVLDEQGIP